MTEKEMLKLDKKRLVKLFVDERKKTIALTAEIDGLQERLKDRKIAVDRAGSIAEAALSLNGVFEAAEEACRQYVENVKASYGTLTDSSRFDIETAREMAEAMLADAKRGAEAILREAKCIAEKMIEEAKSARKTE